MRIISGKYKGRTIVAPSGLPVRPTTDFAKTGLFNILSSRFDFTSCSCLDLYSGTGSISLEFISRGCPNVTAVDRDRGCVEFLKETCLKLSISGLQIIRSDTFDFLRNNRNKFSIIFADPPFDDDNRLKLHELIYSTRALETDGIFILEHITGESYENLPGFSFARTYGNVTFSFFVNFDATQPVS